jgi:hypothetical protein
MKLTYTSAFLLTFFPLFAQPTPTLPIHALQSLLGFDLLAAFRLMMNYHE